MTLCKLCAAAVLILALIWAAAGVRCAEAGFVEASSANWTAGWQAWKESDYETALLEWSKDGVLTDFTPRPSRNYYWRVRALMELGREREAEALKAEMIRKYSFDYYTFLLSPDGGASAYPVEVYGKLAKIFYPRKWSNEVRSASRKTGMPEELIWAVIRRESKFRPFAVSSAGAVGLMQLLPSTASDIAVRLQIPEEETDLNVPEQNILLGASYMMQLVKKFSGDLPRAIAAYNAGASNVSKWNMLGARDWMEWIEEIPYAETREYVRSVLENREVYLLISGRTEFPCLTQIAARPLRPLAVSAFARAGKEAK